MNDQIILRAEQLLDQRRFDLAEAEARRGLANSPDLPRLHAILALSLHGQEKYSEAREAARQAVAADPEWSRAYFIEGLALNGLRKYRDSLEVLDRALELDPYDADIFSARASNFFALSQFSEALESAEEGLACDPEHVGCNNMRAASLMRLDRKEEAGATLDQTLARDPEDAYTHLNVGWAALERGDRKQALVHFRECLRLDPTEDNARQGIIEALKAGFLPYRWLLAWTFWMQSLSPGVQWAVIVGGLIGARVLRANLTAAGYPGLGVAVLGLYLAIVAFMWTAGPLLNLLLRLHPEGRLVLSDEERIAANTSGFLVLLAAVSVGAGVALAERTFLLGGLAFYALIIPLAIAFDAAGRVAKVFMFSVAGVLGVLTIGGLSMTVAGDDGSGFVFIALLGCALSTWAGNFISFSER